MYYTKQHVVCTFGSRASGDVAKTLDGCRTMKDLAYCRVWRDRESAGECGRVSRKRGGGRKRMKEKHKHEIGRFTETVA